jgi:hypothetical protein
MKLSAEKHWFTCMVVLAGYGACDARTCPALGLARWRSNGFGTTRHFGYEPPCKKEPCFDGVCDYQHDEFN